MAKKEKKPAPAKGKAPQPSNPYLAARQEYDSRFGDQAKQRARWQQIAFLLAIGYIPMAMQVRSMASQSLVQPYVVEVDRNGQIYEVGPAEKMQEPSHRMLASELTRFLTTVRSVSSDPLTQRRLAMEAFSYVDQETATFLNTYFSEPSRNPARLGSKLSRLVEVKSILQDPKTGVWKIQWVETVLPLGTEPPSMSNWEGYFTVRLDPPEAADKLQKNPLGLYVTKINWTQITEARPIQTGESGQTARRR